jgi:hypothetical protein
MPETVAVQPTSTLCHQPVAESTLEIFIIGSNNTAECDLLLAQKLGYSSILKMEAESSFETSVHLQWTMVRHVAEQRFS